jgi:hypothetical protein
LLTLGLAASAAAGPREQAKRMHDRLVGIPPPAAVLDSMEASISGGDPVAAAYQAMANPVFYTSALKSFSTPWTNVAQSVYPPLNDYSATVIGIIRDDRPFTDVLTSDLVYVGAAGATSVGYSPTNNTHYEELERNRVDLSDPSLLIAMTQSGLPGSMLTPVDAAGVLTTRAAGEAFFSAGTNRRMLRFTAINFLCRDLEALNDVTRAADRVRQDVTRSPGGDSRVFHNTCVGCHSGMDPMAGAFAYFEWDATQERVIFTPGQVQPKYLINATTFQGGYATVDDRWDNFWRSGQNAILGWRAAAAGGYGPQSFGVEVASSRAFSVCQVEKVFKRLCLRPPGNPQDRAEVERVADVLEANSYRMKRAFAEVATYCMGS